MKNNVIINNSNINLISDDIIFDILRNSYDNFDIWFNKMKDNNIDAYYTIKDNNVTSIMILKIDETDSQQFLEKGKILKIRTFLVNDNKKGIGKMFLDIVNDVAYINDIDYVYLTIKIDNVELIKYMEKNDYKFYSQYNDEFVYYKEFK